MRFAKATFAAALAVTTGGAFATRCEAAPLPTNVAAVKAALGTHVMQVRYGGWRGGWGYRGWGGHRGWGYRGWGLGAATAGAVIGGAIASSAYYGAYPYYGGDPYYGGGYAEDYCSPYGYQSYYPAYSAYHYGW